MTTELMIEMNNVHKWFGDLHVLNDVNLIVNKSENPLPHYAREGDAGMDICESEDVRLKAFNWAVIPTDYI